MLLQKQSSRLFKNRLFVSENYNKLRYKVKLITVYKGLFCDDDNDD